MATTESLENFPDQSGTRIQETIFSKWVLKIFLCNETFPFCSGPRQRLHGTGTVWNLCEIGMDKPCVYTKPGGSGTDRICYLIRNGSSYEGDPIRNCTVPVLNRFRVNRVDPYHSGSDPGKFVWTSAVTSQMRHFKNWSVSLSSMHFLESGIASLLFLSPYCFTLTNHTLLQILAKRTQNRTEKCRTVFKMI